MEHHWKPANIIPYFKLSSAGAVNFNDILIGYQQVTATKWGPTARRTDWW